MADSKSCGTHIVTLMRIWLVLSGSTRPVQLFSLLVSAVGKDLSTISHIRI